MSESTQSKYRRKRNTTSDQPSIEDNEVRITTQGRVKRYVDYAVRLLIGPQEKEVEQEQEEKGTENEEKTSTTKQFDTIVLKATGRAIYSAVTTAEVVKRKVANLHQMTKLDTLEMVDVWEPLEEGLKEVKTSRRVASICIVLSRSESAVEVNAVGYQEPIPAESIGTNRGGDRFRGRGGDRFRGRGGNRDNLQFDNRRQNRNFNPMGRGRRQEHGNYYNNQDRDYGNRRSGGFSRPYGRRQDQTGDSRPREGGRQTNRQNFGGNRQNFGGNRQNFGGNRQNFGGDRQGNRRQYEQYEQ